MTSELSISVITPTADQPNGLALLERYMLRQTALPAQWIVSDDGDVPAKLNGSQEHIVRERTYEGGASLASNVLTALQHAKGDVVAIMEHDDWYAPEHLETQLEFLKKGFLAAGSVNQRYFNVHTRQFRIMRNIGSALCNTVFHKSLIPNMQEACHRAIKLNKICVDRFFWDSVTVKKAIHEQNTVVGIKGLPGRKGLGLGHRPNNREWTNDHALQRLKSWVGEDYREYVRFYHPV